MLLLKVRFELKTCARNGHTHVMSTGIRRVLEIALGEKIPRGQQLDTSEIEVSHPVFQKRFYGVTY